MPVYKCCSNGKFTHGYPFIVVEEQRDAKRSIGVSNARGHGGRGRRRRREEQEEKEEAKKEEDNQKQRKEEDEEEEPSLEPIAGHRNLHTMEKCLGYQLVVRNR